MLSQARSMLQRLGVDVSRYVGASPGDEEQRVFDSLRRLRDSSQGTRPSEETQFLAFVTSRYRTSRAQLFQDLFVLHQLGSLQGGFFVEFGAADGLALSNTALLEADFGWRGILAEPARRWHASLFSQRRCAIDTRCVWSRSGETVSFNETPQAELSTIDAFSESDGHAEKRRAGTRYPVQTISLGDLLLAHGAPSRIDYLSLDTEGSELAILQEFDFAQHEIAVITVEHNHTKARQALLELLTASGFVRKFECFSGWDDWYVAARHIR